MGSDNKDRHIALIVLYLQHLQDAANREMMTRHLEANTIFYFCGARGDDDDVTTRI